MAAFESRSVLLRADIPADAVRVVVGFDIETAGERALCSETGSGHALMAINEFGVLHLWRAPSWEEIAAAEADEKRGALR